MPPPLPPHDRRTSQHNSKPYGDQEQGTASSSNPPETNRNNRFSRHTPGLSLYTHNGLLNSNSNSTDQLQGYGDTQTLRADDTRLQFKGNALAVNPQFRSSGVNDNQMSSNSSSIPQNKQSAEPMAMSVSFQFYTSLSLFYFIINSS